MIGLTERELQIIHDREFLLAKAKVTAKIEGLLSKAREELKRSFSESNLIFPEKATFKSTKISRGENYLGLPYLMLDHPAIFRRDNTFAFRTMFWWGNFFSATLHLEGESLEYYRHKIIDQLNGLLDREIYICVGETPWHHHYGADNYQLLTDDHKSGIRECSFLKLNRKMELNEWQGLPGFSDNFLKLLLELLTVK
jgi:hypothetical protein